jgi:hypothetical protein
MARTQPEPIMRAPFPTPPAFFATGAMAFLAMFALASATPASAQSPAPASSSTSVACRLPPQIRSLGRNVTYLAAGRELLLSAAECEQRGGSWNGRGPGSRAGANAPLAVTVGAGAEGAACPLQATVTVSPGGTLAVRTGPGQKFARSDRLVAGTRVFLCDRAGDAGWAGIVYGSGDCGLAAPIDPPHAYGGRCRSGWVRANYLR